MSLKTKFMILSVFALALSASAVSAQDQASPAVETAVVPAKDALAAPATDELSIYGEVQAADAEAQTITVQYYDYDADEEKTISISCEVATKFENAASVADMKKGDWADVTYALENGKSIAKSIVVEKEESGTLEPAAVEASNVSEPGFDEE
jgi:Cu/Ag efflux protein CusF